jgi:amidohydrolase
MPVGHIGIVSGPAMASPDTFRLSIIGQGGHAALPHDTIDPIAIGAQVVMALQQIVSRQVDPLEQVVLSVTQFHAGTTDNIIPNTAELAGTIRTFNADVRERVPVLMERLIRGVCAAHGAQYTLDIQRGYRPVVNDPALSARLAALVDRTFPPGTRVPLAPAMVGEDFSAYQQKAPGVFAFVGARSEVAESTFAHHHPRFAIDEQALTVGLQYLTAATLDLLAG